MNALDLIDQRITRLQNIVGKIPLIENKEGSEETITDTLCNVGTALSTAVSGRDQLRTMIQRSHELDTYLDPNFIDNHQLLDIKKSYITTVGNDIADNIEQCKEIKKLAPTLDSTNLGDLPDISAEVVTLRKNVLEQKQSNEFIEESLILAMQRYGEIQKNIAEALVKMNLRIDEIESKLKLVKK